MSVVCALPRRSWRAARRRDLAILVALGLPWLAAGALLAQRLGATGTVKHGYRLQAAQGASQWRDQLRQHLLSLEQGPALAALLVGDGAALSTMQWQVLQATGT